MLWFVLLGTVALMMAVSERIWSNPLAIFGAMFVGFCLWICIGVVIKALTL
jgi:hypothetical protein